MSTSPSQAPTTVYDNFLFFNLLPEQSIQRALCFSYAMLYQPCCTLFVGANAMLIPYPLSKRHAITPSCRAMHQIPSMQNKIVNSKKASWSKAQQGKSVYIYATNLTARASVIKSLGNIVVTKGNFLPPLPQLLHTQSISPGLTR